MACRCLFSTKMESSNQKVLEALAWAGRVTCTSAIVVTTNLPVVAELLETLDAAEEIKTAEEQAKVTGSVADVHIQFPVATPKANPAKTKRGYRFNGGEKVECPQCHNQVSAMYMLKDGSKCKMCAIKAKRAQVDQPPLHSALPPNPEHAEENRQEMLARPKENVKLAGLRGRKVG